MLNPNNSCEDEVACSNAEFFLKEFTFYPRDLKINLLNATEIELSDGMVILDNSMLIFQIKERNAEEVISPSSKGEDNWFKSKVLKEAKNQVRNSVKNLQAGSAIKVQNQRGHELSLQDYSKYNVFKIIIYKSEFYDFLSDNCKYKKFYNSDIVGLIHIINSVDYKLIVKKLITPGEIISYFSFREKLIFKYNNMPENFNEKSMLGQYISGSHEKEPKMCLDKYVDNIKYEVHPWWKALVDNLNNKSISTNSANDYYLILHEFAKLKRNEANIIFKKFSTYFENTRTNKTLSFDKYFVRRINVVFTYMQESDIKNKRNSPYRRNNSSRKYIHMIFSSVALDINTLQCGCKVSWVVSPIF